jgi:crotonobetainyl-CoA:carnitine CoA-transferase CaiB-like acyl-CoA transferase
MSAHGVPAAAVSLAYMALDDPQMKARRFFETIEHVHVGSQDYPTWPMRFSAGPTTWWTGPAPTLGQHTEAVLRDELGCSDEELERLRAEHVIGTAPYVRA